MIEDEHTEFKSQFTPKLIKSIVAFLNTDGGTMYLGIDDSGNIIGLSDQDGQANSVVSCIADNVRPDPMMFVSVDSILMDSSPVVRIDVAEGCDKPYYWKEKGLREGGVFIRRGPRSIPASDPLIVRMMRESQSVPYESMPSLKQDLTFDYASDVFEHAGLKFDRPQMQSLGMMDGEMYTNLAFMLSDQFTQGIKMAVFEDEFKSGFLDRDETSGSLLRQYDEAYAFVDRHNNRRSVIDGKYRRDIRDYPAEAVREAITNAIVHRDYSISGSTLVSMFGDRMAVSSIGGVVKGLGLDDIMMGISSRRNEKLASVMYRLRYMEAYGTGIPRVMGLYRDSIEKPSIETSTNVFRLTLPKMSTDGVDPDVARIASSYGKGETFTRADIEGRFGVARSHAYGIVKDALDRGIIEQVGSGRGTEYRRL